ncbi:MAG: ABC transporter permease/substrate-binding protein, partial [Oscillospiraceae bacterium]
MTELQILFKVQFPMALPVIMAGIRISAVTSVGLMTLAAYIGAGGLGELIYSGVQMVNNNMILAGAIPACILALSMDFLFAKIEKAVTPLPLRKGAVLPDSKEKLVALRKNRRRFLSAVSIIMVVLFGFAIWSERGTKEKTIVVTSKYYPEQLLIGNMAADLIEDRTDINVVRKLGMSGTKVCLDALTSGEVDVHVEYTGSMYAGVLAQPMSSDNDHIYNTIKTMYKDRYDLVILGDWGFNNTYSLAVKQSTADKYNLETISDLSKVANKLIFSPPFEFSNREDGMIGLNKAYDLHFKEVKPIDGGLKYTAIDTDGCDIIVAYTTDAQVERYKLKILKDDLNFFMPYHAVPLIRQDTLNEYPELEGVLNILENELTDDMMIKLNYEIEVLG